MPDKNASRAHWETFDVLWSKIDDQIEQKCDIRFFWEPSTLGARVYR